MQLYVIPNLHIAANPAKNTTLTALCGSLRAKPQFSTTISTAEEDAVNEVANSQAGNSNFHLPRFFVATRRGKLL